MGEQVETLEDLLRPGLCAACVGINPSVVSVAAGHYYQGSLGRRFLGRLSDAGAFPHGDGFGDDLAFASGIGFTDISKRPTASAKQLPPDDYEYGKGKLIEKLDEYRPALVIFTFKKTAEIAFGRFEGHGFLSAKKAGGRDVFVMPGPYERTENAQPSLLKLAERFA
jgi:double-stranded uracil-DNA glycosylase